MKGLGEKYMPEAQFTIGQIAEKTKLSIHTLRFYEKEGLVPFIKRNSSGYRLYEEEHVNWIRFLNCLRETGMPISKMKEFVSLTLKRDESEEQQIKMLVEQRRIIENQVNTLVSYMNMINKKIEMYSNEKQDQKTPKLFE